MIIGVTGGIGTGKSTVSLMLADLLRAKIFDADKVVHQLYENKSYINAIFYICPEVVSNNFIDRKILSDKAFKNPEILRRLELLTYNKVVTELKRFVKRNMHSSLILDIPLLYDVNAHFYCDAVLLTRCSRYLQRQRCLKRHNMRNDKLKTILKKQKDFEMLKYKADSIVNTGLNKGATRQHLKLILSNL